MLEYEILETTLVGLNFITEGTSNHKTFSFELEEKRLQSNGFGNNGY